MCSDDFGLIRNNTELPCMTRSTTSMENNQVLILNKHDNNLLCMSYAKPDQSQSQPSGSYNEHALSVCVFN